MSKKNEQFGSLVVERNTLVLKLLEGQMTSEVKFSSGQTTPEVEYPRGRISLMPVDTGTNARNNLTRNNVITFYPSGKDVVIGKCRVSIFR